MELRGYPCSRTRVFVPGNLLVIFYIFLLSSCGQPDPSFYESAKTGGSGNAKPKDDGVDEIPGDTADGGDDTADAGNDTADAGNDTADGGDDTADGGDDTADGGDDTADGGDDTADGGDDTADGGDDTEDKTLVTLNLTQVINNKIDILWVVDSSGSMKEEQALLADGFASLISELAVSDLNFQTAVTSTDICKTGEIEAQKLEDRSCPIAYGKTTYNQGKFFGPKDLQVLSNGSANLITQFTQNAQVGTVGSGFEHGLKAAEMAFQKSIDGSNSALIRPDAFLAVIVVSDEEDDGIGLSMAGGQENRNFWEEGLTRYRHTEDDFINFMNQHKGAGKYALSAITGTRKQNGELCKSNNGNPKEEGTQYIKAAQKTGGTIKSICENNWDQLLEDLGYEISAQITQIALEVEPIEDSIKVFINEIESKNWKYNKGSKTIQFKADSIPEDGDKITITYLKK
ncbi:MAG: hypothetical protein KBD78_11665 [Oligoflexales bacterium]|nr:hypothetical protein [Oligoflexales bacterium]